MIGFPIKDVDPKIQNKFFFTLEMYYSYSMKMISLVLPITFVISTALIDIGASSTVVKASPRLVNMFINPVQVLFFFIAE